MPNPAIVTDIIKAMSKAVPKDFGTFAAEQPGLFSKLEKVATEANFGKMEAEQMRKMITNKQVSPNEVAGTLGELEGTVTKQQVLDEIAQKGTKLDDVVLHDRKSLKDYEDLPPNLQEQLDNYDQGITDYQTFYEKVSDLGFDVDVDYDGTVKDIYKLGMGDLKPVQFPDWQEPGSIQGSYKEHFVVDKREPFKHNLKGDKEVIRRYTSGLIDEDEAHALGMTGDIGSFDAQGWKDGHDAYNEIDNPIVRLRYNDREIDGKKILFLEEMQGPAGDTKYAAWQKVHGNNTGQMEKFDTKREAEEYVKDMSNDIVSFDIEKKVLGQQGKMPPELQARIYDIGVKRAIALAHEGGYDGIAWTTGDMQAKRYSLNRVVNRIDWDTYDNLGEKRIELNSAGGNSILPLRVDKKGIVITGNSELVGKPLDKIIGKENAEKILNGFEGTIRGIELDVGGEGLKSVYDKTLPEKFKKYGKGEIQKIDLNASEQRKNEMISDRLQDAAIANRHISSEAYTQLVDTSSAIYNGMSPREARIKHIEHPEALKLYEEIIDKVSGIKKDTHYMPIKKDTPKRFPIYSALPPLLATGLGAEHFAMSEKDVKGNKVARMRMY